MNNKASNDNKSKKTNIRFEYSKPSGFYLSTKKEFFLANKQLLNKAIKQNKSYTQQSIRKFCKLCKSLLSKKIDFCSHNVDYVFCEHCSHLNGIYEDSKEYVENLYIADNGTDYSTNYIDGDFLQRTNDIYIPKVDFLLNNINSKKNKILDIGCGSGYFVFALLRKNQLALGLDVSKTMVEFGNNQILNHINEKPLSEVNEEDFYKAIVTSNANVISAIGVIEHLREPHKFFDAFKESAAEFLYYSVPMFSFSAILENIFHNVFPRQLSAGHTHLFTESSIKEMNKILGVKSVAEWRFGTDILDLYRHVLINLQEKKSSQKMIDYLNNGFGKKIDEIQGIFDKNHFCSEIHIITTKN